MTTCTVPTTGQVMDSGTVFFPGDLERSLPREDADGGGRLLPRVALPECEDLVTPADAGALEGLQEPAALKQPAAPPVRVVPVMEDWDQVDEWGAQSFPASDPPSNW